MIVRLAHVCIESTDLEATENFYAHLGAKRQFEFRNSENQLVGFYLSFGHDTYIEVIKVKKESQQGVIRHFAIQVEDVLRVRDKLRDYGVDVSERRLGGDNTWMVTCRDPNDVLIEFHQYTPESMQMIGGVCTVDYQP